MSTYFREHKRYLAANKELNCPAAMKLTLIIDPITELDSIHDSSVAVMEAAGILGHQV